MYLIGLVEFHAEDSDEVFSKVGETTFNQEVAKKVMAKQMKQVKREMVNAVMEGTSNLTSKIPTSMVKMVTLLLLNPGAYGQPEDGSEENFTADENDGQTYRSHGWLIYILVFVIYTIFVAGCGMWVGYTKWKMISRWLRKVKPYMQGDWFVDFYRDACSFATFFSAFAFKGKSGDPFTPIVLPLAGHHSHTNG